ncbi:hypothetical protein BO226_19230 [Rhodococcus sp. 2G]|uniref:hypothetical protein n=1 Tax=Rhodococcus sp. 2G TaxID=1570939 RepID=UPI000903E58F|nr:hypothetical protein [Rhodococcus sp. 2G]APE11069.1 hypothetical protein BO226_19230 [Rhodococcus sp. 2G]
MATSVGELEVARHQRELILKPNRMHIFGMGMDVDPIEYITEGSNSQLSELPDGAWDFGLLLKDDAVTLTRELEKSDIMAVGYNNPIRSDFTSDIAGLQFTGLEANRYNIENNLGMDLSNMVANPETGEIAFDQSPSQRSVSSGTSASPSSTPAWTASIWGACSTRVRSPRSASRPSPT